MNTSKSKCLQLNLKMNKLGLLALQSYLTDVWKLSFTQLHMHAAAGIINISTNTRLNENFDFFVVFS
ncbi:hypothetical protein ACJIZ3_022750 [Penstemon smallii]|uniref:Uncharacterized protein n=1 Tax=Penstemon smallii TaxID=265156 RepID=A0ABD3TM80_9LAMI